MDGVAVVVPWRPGCPHREAAWRWVRARYAERHPDWFVVEGRHEEGTWRKATAVAAAVETVDATTLIVADADVWCEHLAAAVDRVRHGAPWAIPHRRVYRLTPQATTGVFDGDEPAGPTTEPPYKGWPGGGLAVLPTDTYRRIPLDPRFEGWGHEDLAWARALICLAGSPWRGAAPLWHLWHPPQDRPNRQLGSPANRQLGDRYATATRRPGQMRALLEEVTACRSTASS